MNRIYRFIMLATGVAGAFLAGCASEEKKDATLARVGDETPPDLIMGPASVALKDIDGFSAKMVEADSPGLLGVSTPARAGRTFTGQVLGRKGRLIFQPAATANVKKEIIRKGGMIFIEDLGSQRGFVLSEALQGYAPIFPLVQITNLLADNTALASEVANGHPCHRMESMVSLSDGSSAKLTEWRADDLQRFPVRIHVSTGTREETVDFTDVRLDLPAAELFVPPADFTQYANSGSLINELMIRESGLRKGSTMVGPGAGGAYIPAGTQNGIGAQPY